MRPRGRGCLGATGAAGDGSAPGTRCGLRPWLTPPPPPPPPPPPSPAVWATTRRPAAWRASRATCTASSWTQTSRLRAAPRCGVGRPRNCPLPPAPRPPPPALAFTLVSACAPQPLSTRRQRALNGSPARTEPRHGAASCTYTRRRVPLCHRARTWRDASIMRSPAMPSRPPPYPGAARSALSRACLPAHPCAWRGTGPCPLALPAGAACTPAGSRLSSRHPRTSHAAAPLSTGPRARPSCTPGSALCCLRWP